jgi:hypothetical protein
MLGIPRRWLPRHRVSRDAYFGMKKIGAGEGNRNRSERPASLLKNWRKSA